MFIAKIHKLNPDKDFHSDFQKLMTLERVQILLNPQSLETCCMFISLE
jgi:hypothetical protein